MEIPITKTIIAYHTFKVSIEEFVKHYLVEIREVGGLYCFYTRSSIEGFISSSLEIPVVEFEKFYPNGIDFEDLQSEGFKEDLIKNICNWRMSNGRSII